MLCLSNEVSWMALALLKVVLDWLGDDCGGDCGGVVSGGGGGGGDGLECGCCVCEIGRGGEET